MPDTINLSWADVYHKAEKIANAIASYREKVKTIELYGVPRGGIFAAQAVSTMLFRRGVSNRLVGSMPADFIIDDIYDTGKTADAYEEKWEAIPFLTLVNKDEPPKSVWYSFPWERMTNDNAPVENIRRLLEYIGEDPTREGLKDTPDRVIKSFETLYKGYSDKPENHMKIFKDGSCNEMVLLKNIEFYSTCEHHMLPFFGKAHIAYIPDKELIGVSKLARILEVFTRRLQIQERICQQVTDALQQHLAPMGVACILEAQHFCMTARGIQKQNSIMTTSSLLGEFKTNATARMELLNRIG